MADKYIVKLTKKQITTIQDILKRGLHTAQLVNRANALLLAHQGFSDDEIAERTQLSNKGVQSIRKRFVVNGFEVTLHGKPKSGRPHALSEKDEAKLIALTCEKAPDGHSRQTIRGLTAKLVTEDGRSVSRSTVARTLKKNDLKPWQVKSWNILPENREKFNIQRDIVLDEYEKARKAPDPQNPLVCMDESPFQLLGEVREPIPMKPGSPKKVDSEYIRCGTANMFVFVSPFLGIRRIDVTDRRTRSDFAHQIRKLVKEDYPHAKKITLVLDNLNTHNEKSLYETFSPSEAKEILKKIIWVRTPVHGSWLNAAEIEIGRAKRSGLKKRVSNKKDLKKQVKQFVRRSNRDKLKINWNFTSKEARARDKKVRARERRSSGYV